MSSARKVVKLKKTVPADWIAAAHSSAPRPGSASQVWTAPPAVKNSEPTKNVTASARGPTRSR